MAKAAVMAAPGSSRKAICRRPVPTSARKPGPSPAAASRESAGNSTAATATENMPCGSM